MQPHQLHQVASALVSRHCLRPALPSLSARGVDSHCISPARPEALSRVHHSRIPGESLTGLLGRLARTPPPSSRARGFSEPPSPQDISPLTPAQTQRPNAVAELGATTAGGSVSATVEPPPSIHRSPPTHVLHAGSDANSATGFSAATVAAEASERYVSDTLSELAQLLDAVAVRAAGHQTAYARQRAQSALGLDKARWDAKQMDFRLMEVQSNISAACAAAEERLRSRLATLRQVREDGAERLRVDVASALRCEHDAMNARMRDACGGRMQTLDALAGALHQMDTHADVTCAGLRQRVADTALRTANQILATARAQLAADAQKAQSAHVAMCSLVERFAEETQRQLEELQVERRQYQERMSRRVMTLLGERPVPMRGRAAH